VQANTEPRCGIEERNDKKRLSRDHDDPDDHSGTHCTRLLRPAMPTMSPTTCHTTFTTAPMRILLVKTSSLGDVIHNLPVATDLAREFPEARIDWVVEENFAAIPALHPAVDRVIPIAIRRWRKHLGQLATWQEMRAARRALREHEYDLIIDSQGLCKSAVVTRQARGWKCGYSAECAREPIAARSYDETFTIPRQLHAIRRNRWLAAAAADLNPPDDEHGGRPEDRIDYGLTSLPPPAYAPSTPYAVLLTATSRDDKLWPEADWLALGQALAERGLSCVLPGGNPTERERAARLAGALPDAIAAPPGDLPTLAGLLAGAQLVVGVDTGLTHLAAAVATPTVAIYCASEPGLTGVLGSAFACNLGGNGSPPTAEAVIAACEQALASA
jgi:heptosyltransferase-1